MYGVPADLPLQPFVGHELNQICLGRFQVQLHCSDVGSISIEGGWELRDAANRVVDRSCEHGSRDTYRLHQILDVPIHAYENKAPTSFVLLFENGLSLEIFDDDARYETFSLTLNDGAMFFV